MFSDDEVSHLSDDDEEEGFSGEDENTSEKTTEKPDVWEDIYGRKRDKEGNVIRVSLLLMSIIRSSHSPIHEFDEDGTTFAMR